VLSLSKTVPSLQGPRTTFVVDSSIMAVAMVGIDVVGKLTPTQGNNTFAIVTVEHFTKWVEAKPIIIDNTKYFYSATFKDFCHQIGTKVSFTSLYHPQSNEAVERANALIFEVIKKILKGQKKGKWAEVMPRVLWSHNTTVCRATNFTPFRLLLGAEAVLPKEIKHQNLHTTTEAPSCPNEAEEKDLLEQKGSKQ
jgi:hypothetical protein